jgi:nitric oxide reductase subunit C
MIKTANTRFYIGFFGFLVSLFCLYNFTVYHSSNSDYNVVLSQKALQGQQLWQQNNCFSCYQLYGLGGYLGPDLTNIYSAKGKGTAYINAFLNSGVKTMPKFNFSEDEKSALIAFLKAVDKTGYFPNHNATIHPNGWVEIQYKNEK